MSIVLSNIWQSKGIKHGRFSDNLPVKLMDPSQLRLQKVHSKYS